VPKYVLSVLVAGLLVGCSTSPSYWTHPTQWREQYAEDAAICQAQARSGTQIFARCMTMQGWPQSDELLRSAFP
jgi:hypothetical protein